MKTCLRCEQENQDDAISCLNCRHLEFAPSAIPAIPSESCAPRVKSGIEYLTTEREGKLTVLKCRTPGEAFLVANELEASDILVMLPDEDALLNEYQSNGFVSIKVSAQSYEAAKDLQSIIERKHWEERAQQPLSLPMIILAIGLGLMPIPGFLVIFMVNDAHKTKGYKLKAKTFPRWFYVGCAFLFGLIVVLSNLYR